MQIFSKLFFKKLKKFYLQRKSRLASKMTNRDSVYLKS